MKGLTSIVHLTNGDYKRSIDQRVDKRALFDLVSYKNVQEGRFYLLAPVELFDNKGLSDIYKDGDIIREQMGELLIRLAKFAAEN